MSNPFNIDTISAGADWVQWRRSRLKKSNYVKLYELTKIRTSYGSGELYLAIYDDERGMDRSLSEWHRDRRIWRYTCADGSRRSIARGDALQVVDCRYGSSIAVQASDVARLLGSDDGHGAVMPAADARALAAPRRVVPRADIPGSL
ncbi:hypothetical protein [Prauserella muralis]|uniref:Uncharacterized protein n=1 Tax=Prauserella muralis TaxID=588067 RepID=A0A2V4BEN8_9PSEU|nr:hypothetical protein [Prauserella muralis]PXY32509.1 hypothetical protein BAY60_09670 [Prauserella muralis]TWE23786.1 hypothetical protein FHX69_5086 [Prauserella muralis]